MKAAAEPRTLGCRGYAWPGLPPPCLAFMAVKDLCSDRYTEVLSSTQHIRKISQASVTLTARVSCSGNVTDFLPREVDRLALHILNRNPVPFCTCFENPFFFFFFKLLK